MKAGKKVYLNGKNQISVARKFMNICNMYSTQIRYESVVFYSKYWDNLYFG